MPHRKRPKDEEIAEQHRRIFAKCKGWEFFYPFPGLAPSSKERRSYIKLFCTSYLPRRDQQTAYITIYEEGSVTVSKFTWEVDKVFWEHWCLRLGPDGRDFEEIQNNLTENCVELGQAPVKPVVSNKRDIKISLKTAHLLVIGPVNPEKVHGVTFFNTLVNGGGIKRLWDDIRAWYCSCMMEEMITLRSFLQAAAEARKPPLILALPPAFQKKPNPKEAERQAFEKEINDILDEGKPAIQAFPDLRLWAMDRKKSVYHNLDQRIDLVAGIWKERNQSSGMMKSISDWIERMRHGIKAEQLRHSRRRS
ncbi:hypothetical protein F53441_4233 [Fusarium austroafricanum]|uniref:Uncharacterized protein n=1 Tax=Fusarium austroafricanum TaxID=2364996 RepID=A0A8H4P9N4_9HYPO|nr:hypothetical protein F53441_4233 [Fusarium austroafricanum]